ncbi:TPA: metal-sensitive transcriptional regulator [Candidatus Ventrenecus avicola]|nr:metal-sensitive transcriptional regulator [Candidatus Ventrenecus avicola]
MEKENGKRKETPRTVEEKKRYTNRLSVIEGQVRGVKEMILEDRYCDDILMQMAAVVNSLRSLEKEILKSHLDTCMTEKIKNNDPKAVEEIMSLFKILK